MNFIGTQKNEPSVFDVLLYYKRNKKSLSWKHAYSNILKILPTENENFQIRNSDIFFIPAQNIDCGYSLEPPQWGGSTEYPQYNYVRAQKRKIMYTPVNPSFTIKNGVKGVKII